MTPIYYPILTEDGDSFVCEDGDTLIVLEYDGTSSVIHSPAEVVQQLLIDAGLGTDPDDGEAYPVYSTNEPDGADEVITVYDTAGTPQGDIQYSGESILYDGIQIRVRARSHRNYGWRLATDIRDYLSQGVSYTEVSLEGVRYIVYSFNRIGPVLSLGKDPAVKYSVYTLNVNVAYERLSDE